MEIIMSFPPHLPAPSCDIDKHHKWQRLKIIFVATFFGLIAGLTGASMILGWILPTIGDGGWTLGGNLTAPRAQLDDRVQREMADKIFTVYQKLSLTGNTGYLSADDKLADAALVTSDGWAVAYLPNFDGRYKDWRVLGSRGILYHVDRALLDKRTGLIYLKIVSPENISSTNEQFKVVTFGEARGQTDNVFSLQDNSWHAAFILAAAPFFNESHLDTAPALAYALNVNFRAGSLVVDNQGRMVGVITKNNLLMPAVVAAHILPGLQDKKRVVYPSLGVEGWLSEERTIILNEEKVTGFFVNKILVANTTLRRGDVILEIDGHAVGLDNLWYNTIGAKVRLKVLRGGKALEIEAIVAAL